MKTGSNISQSFLLVFLMFLGLFGPLCEGHSEGGRGENSNNHIRQGEHEHEFVHVPSSFVETHYVYMNLKKSAHFQCANVEKSSLPGNLQNESQDAVQWFQTLPGLPPTDLSQKCNDQEESDDDSKNPEDRQKCFFVYSQVKNNPSQFYSTLRIRRVESADYNGTYDCRVNGVVVRKFELRGELRATRKSKIVGKEKETERSVIIHVGEQLHLYCNYTQAEFDKYINISTLSNVTVSWFKLKSKDANNTLSWENITDDLRNSKEGIFQNFEEIEPNQFSGPADHSHRGEYNCSVNLLPHPGYIVYGKMFPVEYRFQVRVRDSDRWMVPGGILLVEVLCMGIFTAIIWKREDSKEVDNDALPQDSDSEEEQSPKLT